MKLSLCIPTYNFGRFLGVVLESVIDQINEDVEVVIVDGGSTDDTAEIVSTYQSRYNNIKFFARNRRVGVDLDLAKTVELASGEYCWFISADDKVKQGAIERILEEIESKADIYLCNRTECNINLKPLRDRFWLSRGLGDKAFDLSNKRIFLNYLNNAHSIGALFSYCSSIIFKREKWNSVAYNDKFTGSGYAHVHRLFSFLTVGCQLKYIRTALVFCRLDNDSFLDKGKVKRFLLDIDGYNLLADSLFLDDPEIKKAFLRVVAREIRDHYLIEIRSLVENDDKWQEIKDKLLAVGFNRFKVNAIGMAGSNKFIANSLLEIKNRIKKRREQDASSFA
jgi:abequosyltransferase